MGVIFLSLAWHASSIIWGFEPSCAHLQVVVATNCMLKQAIALDSFCHRTKSAFIRADVRGVFASIFCNFGPNHTVLDVDGESLLTTESP